MAMATRNARLNILWVASPPTASIPLQRIRVAGRSFPISGRSRAHSSRVHSPWQALHPLRASSLLSSPSSLRCFHGNNGIITRCNNESSPRRSVSIRWITDGTNTANKSTNAPFESHKSSATVRHQLGSLPGSKKTAPPGRLIRKPRRVPSSPPSAGVESGVQANNESPISSSTPAANVNGDSSSSVHPTTSLQQPQSRQAQRKAAIDRRGIFLLEKGATTSLSSAAVPENVAASAVTAVVANDEIGEDIHSNNQQTMDNDDGSNNISSQNQMSGQRRRRIPLHSIGNGNLSAADLHRVQLKQQRDHLREQQKQQSLMHLTHSHEDGHNSTTSSIRSNAHRASSVGGSLVASQSATAKYRLSRQHRGKIDTAEDSSMQDLVSEATTTATDQGGNLKTNPSVMTIPLSDQLLSDDYDSLSRSSPSHDGHSSPSSNFEERYQRLRRQRQQQEQGGGDAAAGGEDERTSSSAADGDNTNESWSPFGWLWGRQKK